MSSSSRPGTTTRPGSCTSARSLAADRQLHVGRRELDRRLGIDCASIRTPERICTLERCDTPRATTWRSLEKVVLGAGDAHGARSLDGSAAHTASVPGRPASEVVRCSTEREPVERSRRVEAVGGCEKYLLTEPNRAHVWTGDAHPRSPGWSRARADAGSRATWRSARLSTRHTRASPVLRAAKSQHSGP